MRDWLFSLALLWAIALSSIQPAYTAQQDTRDAGPAAIAAKAGPDDEGLVETRHAITVAGKRIEYTATAGYLPLIDDTGKLLAKMFFVAYVEQDMQADPHRPITFAFNGGPGASSMWLHLGVGPRRVVLPQDGTVLPRSTVLTDNEATWLAFTDLVFIDPVGTGYSRAAEGADERQFYDVVRDIEAAGAFVRRYLTRHQRWLSPKFIAGESYGTTRAAGLVNQLQKTSGINVNGLMLISSVLDFQTIAFEPSNDLAYVLALPSYAATLWYHDMLSGSLADVLREAEQWTIEEYLVGLTKGESMSDVERNRLIDRLSRYTRFDRQELKQRRLHVGPQSFGRNLMASSGRIVGRFDSRVTGSDAIGNSQSGDPDPSFFLVTGPLVEGLNDYLRGELQFRSDLRYEYLSREANRSWKWRTGGQGYLYVADDLAEAMSRDPRLRVFAAAGYYDLATPYFAQRYSFDHMELAASLRSHLTFVAYPSGHQIYTDPVSANKLKADVEKFVRCTVEESCE
jgi:carboxypeptidase C (cathepsin A)